MNNDTDSRAIVQSPSAASTSGVLAVIERASKDPLVDVDKLERLLAMQKEVLADQRHMAFSMALSRLQEKMPQIVKNGAIRDGQRNVRSKYAKLEDIDSEIRPLCSEEGFAFSYDSKRVPDGIEFSCEMSHRDGHTATKTIVLPVDNGAGRNGVQSVGSTTSYARRYLLQMHLNLVFCDEDDDGQSAGVREPSAPTVEPDRTDWKAEIASAASLEALNGINARLKASFEAGRIHRDAMAEIVKLGKARRAAIGRQDVVDMPASADDGPRQPGQEV